MEEKKKEKRPWWKIILWGGLGVVLMRTLAYLVAGK
jgi:hypothetical protein